MTSSINGGRGVIARPAVEQAANPQGALQAAAVTQDALGLRRASALATGEPVLPLTPADPQENRLARVPPEVVQLVANFLELPQQVALGSASRQMRATIHHLASYQQIYSVFSEVVSQDRALQAQISAEIRRGASLYSEYQRARAGDRDCGIELYENYLEDKEASGETVASLSTQHDQLRSLLPALLGPYVDLYVRLRSPEPFATLISTCERLLQAPTAAEKKQIYLQQLRPAADVEHLRDHLADIVEAADRIAADNRMEDMQALVRTRLDALLADPALRRNASIRLVDDWTRQLVQMLSAN
ncbi:MAG: hypothetical protein V4669_12880 [Pseudomonadota bacterium]